MKGAIQEEMPPCEDWEKVKVFSKLLRVIAKVSGSVFIGPELCREEEYIDASINYTIEVFNTIKSVKEMKSWKRPFLARYLPAMKEIKRRREQARKFLVPIIAARQTAAKEPGYQKPDDMMQWVMDRYEKEGKPVDPEFMGRAQLNLSLAAIHTTSISATNLLYTLAAMPEYIEPLREEIKDVLSRYDGVFTMKALQDLKKVDSFIMESMRVYPIGSIAFQRKALKGITLSDGLYIPPGTFIEVAMVGVNRDPDLHVNQEQFDGLRSYKLRSDKNVENANRHQVVGVTPKNLTFGYGSHACPGRFFAVNEIKLILATLLLHYDVQNVGTERYKQLDHGVSSVPDPNKELLFKAVSV